MKRKLWFGIGVLAMFGMALWMREWASWRPVLVATSKLKGARGLDISGDGRFLVVANTELYDLKNHRWMPDVPPTETFYGFAPSQTYFSVQDYLPVLRESSDSDHPLKIVRRNRATGQAVWSARTSRKDWQNYLLGVALSANQKQVLVGAERYSQAFDAQNGRLLWNHPALHVKKWGFDKDSFQFYGDFPHGRFIRGHNQKESVIVETATGRVVWRRPTQNQPPVDDVSLDETLGLVIEKGNRNPLIDRFDPLTARFFDVKRDKLLWTLPIAGAEGQLLPLFSPDSRTVILMTQTGIERFEARTGKRLSWRGEPGREKAVAMALSRDGNSIYTSDKAGRIWKWRLK